MAFGFFARRGQRPNRPRNVPLRRHRIPPVGAFEHQPHEVIELLVAIIRGQSIVELGAIQKSRKAVDDAALGATVLDRLPGLANHGGERIVR